MEKRQLHLLSIYYHTDIYSVNGTCLLVSAVFAFGLLSKVKQTEAKSPILILIQILILKLKLILILELILKLKLIWRRVLVLLLSFVVVRNILKADGRLWNHDALSILSHFTESP